MCPEAAFPCSLHVTPRPAPPRVLLPAPRSRSFLRDRAGPRCCPVPIPWGRPPLPRVRELLSLSQFILLFLLLALLLLLLRCFGDLRCVLERLLLLLLLEVLEALLRPLQG